MRSLPSADEHTHLRCFISSFFLSFTSLVFIVSALCSPPAPPAQHSTYLKCPSLKGSPHAATQSPVICSNYTFASLHINRNRDPLQSNWLKSSFFFFFFTFLSKWRGGASADTLSVAGICCIRKFRKDCTSSKWFAVQRLAPTVHMSVVPVGKTLRWGWRHLASSEHHFQQDDKIFP